MSNMLDRMIAEQSTLLARKTKYKQQILQKKDKQQAFDVLANVKILTSGQLAMNDCWTLGPTVLEKVREKEDKEEKKQRLREEKKK
jgi:hypothetical protein